MRAFRLALVVALSLALVLWLVWLGDCTPPPAPHDLAGEPLEVQVAFWAFLGLVAGWIWNGVQAAGRIALHVLAWSVKALWAFATASYNALKTVGEILARGARKAWDFFRLTYDKVLKPAWQKFWKFVEWAQRELEEMFSPILDFLQTVKDHVLAFYTKWIQPVLDTISVARKVTGILASLGIEWAKRLDAKLLELEQRIYEPFQHVLRHLNGVINIVNRVVTLDGLFQRLAFIRTIERDLRYVSRALVNWRSKPLTEAEISVVKERGKLRTPAEAEEATTQYLRTGDGPYRPLIDEMTAQWRIYLRRPE